MQADFLSMDKKRRLEQTNPADLVEKHAHLRKLLAPLPTEKLVDLLTRIGGEVEYAYTEIEKVANEDLTQRKVFIHGLPWDCTKETLVEPFSFFGEVEDTNVVMDNQTGKTRGYGFVTFKTMADAYKALAAGSIQIQDRPVQMKLAALRSNPILHGSDGEDTTMRKLFVRGLLSHHTSTDLEALFQKYGELEEVKITTDRVTGASKGYGFVTFTQASAATSALEQPHKEYNGRTIHCKLAALGAPKKKEEPAAVPRGNPQREYGAPAGGMGPAAQALAARRSMEYQASMYASHHNPYAAAQGAYGNYASAGSYASSAPSPAAAPSYGQLTPMQTGATTQQTHWG